MFSERKKENEIQRAVSTGKLEVLRFIDVLDSDKYKEFYANRHNLRLPDLTLDLTCVEDLYLRRRLAEFILSAMDLTRLSCYSFHEYRLLAFDSLIKKAPEFLQLNYAEFLDSTDNILKIEALDVAKARAFLHSFSSFCDDLDYKDDPMRVDLWKLSWFNIARDRDYTRKYNSLSFVDIKNERNKALVKYYIDYCLRNTGMSLQTIYGRMSRIKACLNLLDKPFDEWASEDCRQLAEKIQEKYSNKKTVSSSIAALFSCADFLVLHDYIAHNPIKELRDLTRTGTFEYKTTAADHSTVLQIFNALATIKDERIVLAFLLIYSVGMRSSEACSIGYDCLESREGNTFVRYYSQKMKKEVCNVIPQSLYNRIKRYRDNIPRGEFLFPSAKPKDKRFEKPIASSFLSDEMNKAMVACHVVNPDGSPYHFAAHSFRHLFAVKMREQKIPVHIIQNHLHHESIEMTMVYLEYIDKTKIRKMSEFIDIHGNSAAFDVKSPYDEDIQYANYIRKKMAMQMLPNGVCARPIQLGECMHGNTCLTCPEFRTSCADLPAHKNQLRQIDSLLEQAKQNGWLPQIETNEKIRRNLLAIIARLEEMSREQ